MGVARAAAGIAIIMWRHAALDDSDRTGPAPERHRSAGS